MKKITIIIVIIIISCNIDSSSSNDIYSEYWKSIETRGMALYEYPEDFDVQKVITAAEAKWKGIDRKQMLRTLFQYLTKGCTKEKEKHIAVLTFLQRISIQCPKRELLYEDGSMVHDPLVLLEIGFMRCGQVNRLGADIFSAAGYKTRIVGLKSHTIAEIFYDNSWHYFDADTGSNGICIFDSRTENIPSVKEINESKRLQEQLDCLNIYSEYVVSFGQNDSRIYMSWAYCPVPTSYGGGYYYKTASKLEEQNRIYGWNYYYYEIADWVGQENTNRYMPSSPFIEDVKKEGNEIEISWQEAVDNDNDLLGYKVFISSRSRNWEYPFFKGSATAEQSWDGRQTQGTDVYLHIEESPIGDIAVIDTTDNRVNFTLNESDVFVVIMPYDEYGKSIGKTVYTSSNEIHISP